MEKDRVDKFKAEDFFLRKNMVPLMSRQGISNAEFKKHLMKLNQSSRLLKNHSQ
jgi:hypothetical protein